MGQIERIEKARWTNLEAVVLCRVVVGVVRRREWRLSRLWLVRWKNSPLRSHDTEPQVKHLS